MVSITRAGFGWPTRSRALALTALVAENFPGLRFVMASMSMKEVLPEWKCPPGFQVLVAGAEESRGSSSRFYRRDGELETMEERDFFNETIEQRAHTLTCPKCGQPGEYKVTWVVRRKRAQLPRGADERDRAKFAKA